MARDRRRRKGRPLQEVGKAATAAQAAIWEYQALGRELREFGVDISVWMKDGAPALRVEVADSEIERDEAEGGRGLLNILVGLLGKK